MNSSIESGIGASGYGGLSATHGQNLTAFPGESPSKLRIRQLSEKLTGLASGLEAEKLVSAGTDGRLGKLSCMQARKENILSKLRTLDERVQNNQISERNKFNVMEPSTLLCQQ